MARFYSALDDKHRSFIAAQKLFFTATAPSDGRINLSPKGMDSLRVIDAQCVAYLDLTGSGNETGAHLKHDGRMTMMFCSFDADPLILRLYAAAVRCGARMQTGRNGGRIFPRCRASARLLCSISNRCRLRVAMRCRSMRIAVSAIR